MTQTAWWKVLMLFLIPVGGGIPGGVLLGHSHGLGWPVLCVLYFVSDVVLAFIFEPLLKLMQLVGRRVAFLAKLGEKIREANARSAAKYGTAAGPLTLVAVSFAVDPMTGRTAASAAGYGFVPGWAIAITGDMGYFVVIMLSTLWLGSKMGETAATVLMLVLMFTFPVLLRKARQLFEKPQAAQPVQP